MLCELLVNEKAIKKSKVLPFRFITAWNELGILGNRRIMNALSKAIDMSLDNCPELSGKTLVALDESGSMVGRPWDIGSLFASVLYKGMDADFMQFARDARYVTPDPNGSIMGIKQSLNFGGGGTNFPRIFEVANKPYDRVIILSDMQSWLGYYSPRYAYREYCRRCGFKSDVFCFDLAGYGDMEFPEDNIYCVSGFSDKAFDIIATLGEDKNAMIHEIESIQI
jgi:hypothetical protein